MFSKQVFLLFIFFSLNTSRIIAQDSSIVSGFEFMTIVSEFPDNKLFLIYISKSNGEYERLEFENRGTFKYWQTTKLLHLLQEYSKSGWNVENSNLTKENNIGYVYYLLKRDLK